MRKQEEGANEESDTKNKVINAGTKCRNKMQEQDAGTRCRNKMHEQDAGTRYRDKMKERTMWATWTEDSNQM